MRGKQQYVSAFEGPYPLPGVAWRACAVGETLTGAENELPNGIEDKLVTVSEIYF